MATPFTFTLHAPREDLHDRVAERAGDFVNTTREMADAAGSGSVRVRIPVHYRTFGLLSDTIALAADLLRVPVPGGVRRFQPGSNETLRADLDGHLREVEDALAGSPVEIAVDEADPLFEIVGRLKGAVGHETDADVLRLFGAITGGAYVGPRVFHLDLSNRCNTDCAYCWFHSDFAAGRADAADFDEGWRSLALDFDVFEKLVDDLSALGTTEDIVLSGKGEPLTHPRIADMLRLLGGREMNTTLFTNGILLNEDAARLCVETGVNLLYVSLSACGADSYARLHNDPPAGEFDRIVANCKRLVEIKRESGAPVPELVLVSILTNRNAGEIVPFARLAADIGADHLRYQLMAVEDYNRDLALTPEQMSRLSGDLAEAKRIADAAGIHVIENIDVQLEGTASGSQDWSGDSFLQDGCYAGWLFSRVWADGRVSFCCVPKPLGGLNRTRFAELWRSETYTKVRNDAKYIAEHKGTVFDDGSTLWDQRCTRCPHYEQIRWLFDLAERLHVKEWLR